MSDVHARALAIHDFLRERRQTMVELLVDLASEESPTDVPASQLPVQERLRQALAARGFDVRHLAGRRTGGHLFAVPAERRHGLPAQLLIGHSDTVWPVGTTRSMPVVVENGRVRGPGTFDMKAGLVQGLFALDALHALGLEPPATPVWLINSDEETGSPESKRWVRLVSRHAVRTFVLEPALGPEGRLKTARKGVARFTVSVHGRAAHAGLDPTAGASAIEELAHVVRRLHALTDLERGTTVNVGVVRGGIRPNVVAPLAEADVDVRFVTMAEGEAVTAAIRGIAPRTPGTRLEWTGGIEISPLERTQRNQALWAQARAAAERLGFALEDAISGGGSDGNTTSRFTATLDGLGAIGDGAHATHEHVVIDGMVQRAALLAELLMAPVRGAT